MRLLSRVFLLINLVTGARLSPELPIKRFRIEQAAKRNQEWKAYNLVKEQPDVLIDQTAETMGCTWVNGVVWDKPLIEKFYKTLKLLRPNAVVLDIGAQTGSFTLLAKFFPQSSWYAFEPLGEVTDVLARNLAINGIQNVEIVPVAVGSMSGTATLQVPPREFLGLCTLGDRVVRFTPVESRVVPIVSLDEFLEARSIDRVDLIKIDTEGAEYSILRGAQFLIRRCKPIILLEYFDVNMRQCGVNKEEFESFLIELGYTWQKVGLDDILCIPGRD